MVFAIVAWKRAARSDHEDDSASEATGPESKKNEGHNGHSSAGESNKEETKEHKEGNNKPKARMSFKAASQATLTFISARKRIEDGLKNWTKRRVSKRDALEGTYGQI